MSDITNTCTLTQLSEIIKSITFSHGTIKNVKKPFVCGSEKSDSLYTSTYTQLKIYCLHKKDNKSFYG